ncbi:uncharacterized protein LOC125757907 [Rhipicephalus sanguineus]|uniref:uncharacterized protein LOC125757907 n=1 Tax=Rhipicephalus sanguineus TaxID=34632 RepID=UPI0020C4DDFF|nr:uncharacterized protein LOC125757907 [Rhipicephalus sanguineus]
MDVGVRVNRNDPDRHVEITSLDIVYVDVIEIEVKTFAPISGRPVTLFLERPPTAAKLAMLRPIIQSGLQRMIDSGGAAVTEQRPLRRVRRQWRFICRSDDSFTQLMTNVMDVNRELLRATQPLHVGDSEHLGLVRDKFTSVCNETTMNLVFRLTLEKPYIVFDLAAPLGSNVLAGGQLTVKTDSLDVDIGLVTPKIKKSDEKVEPQVPFADVRRAHNLRLEFTGMSPATTAMTSLLALLQQLIPSVQTRLFEIILTRVLRNYVATTPMPF